MAIEVYGVQTPHGVEELLNQTSAVHACMTETVQWIALNRTEKSMQVILWHGYASPHCAALDCLCCVRSSLLRHSLCLVRWLFRRNSPFHCLASAFLIGTRHLEWFELTHEQNMASWANAFESYIVASNEYEQMSFSVRLLYRIVSNEHFWRFGLSSVRACVCVCIYIFLIRHLEESQHISEIEMHDVYTKYENDSNTIVYFNGMIAASQFISFLFPTVCKAHTQRKHAAIEPQKSF